MALTVALAAALIWFWPKAVGARQALRSGRAAAHRAAQVHAGGVRLGGRRMLLAVVGALLVIGAHR